MKSKTEKKTNNLNPSNSSLQGAAIAVSVVALGVGAFLMWRNREKMMELADRHLGLPESWKTKDRIKNDTDFGVPYKNRNNNSMNESRASGAV